MRLRFGLLPAAIWACLLVVVPCVQAQTYKISGRVVYEEGNLPAEGIRVELQKFSGEQILMRFTRPNGEFEFPRLPAGSYYVAVVLDGYEAVRMDSEITRFDITGITIFLVRTGVRAPGPGGTISVKQLRLSKKAREAFQKAMDARYEKKDARGSLPHFEEALSEEPNYFEAHYEVGLIYMQLELPNAAEDAFRKAIAASDETFAKPFVALAALLCDQDKFADAEPLARKGAALEPGMWRGHYELSRALLGLGRLDEAEKSWEQARTRRPDFPDLYLLAANLHMRRNDLPALKKDFAKYLELTPNGPASASVREMLADVERRLAQAKPATKENEKP